MNPNTRYEIRGTIRRAKLSLLGARQALLEGVEDEDCLMTPSDMRLIRSELKDMTILLSDVKKAANLFGVVSDAKSAMTV